jgi:hypothetical protein
MVGVGVGGDGWVVALVGGCRCSRSMRGLELGLDREEKRC